jgi:prepilin-type N-terminal cleavage/methylation domain-containing protein
MAARGQRGFTILEVMLTTVISAFVFAGVLSAFIFMARALSRQVNAEGLESRTRLTLFYFNQDVSSATSIAAQNPGAEVTGDQMSLTVPTSTGTSNTVTYHCDWSGGASNGILERQVNSGAYLVLLTNISSISFQYYDATTHLITVASSAPSSPQVDIKQVGVSFTTSAGYAPSGNVSNLTMVSPLAILKNKGMLVDPNSP